MLHSTLLMTEVKVAFPQEAKVTDTEEVLPSSSEGNSDR